MFITFEGIDGSGKSTQLKKTAVYLKNMGYDVICIREPGGTVLSEKIRYLLLSSKNKISPISELLLFESARADLCLNVIKPALENGKFVLSDRFYDSTTAYQGYGRGIDLQYIEILNQFSSMQLIPDLTFYLKVDLKLSHNRTINKSPDRMELSGNDFFSNVIKGFDEIANKNERVKIIDSYGLIEDTFIQIKNLIDSALKTKTAL